MKIGQAKPFRCQHCFFFFSYPLIFLPSRPKALPGVRLTRAVIGTEHIGPCIL